MQNSSFPELNINNPAELLHGILNSISDVAVSRDLDSLLQILSKMAHKLVPSDRCAIWIYDDKKEILWTKVADGVDRIESPHDQGVVGYVLTTGDSIIINNPYSDYRFNKEIDKNTGYKTNNIIALPLINSEGETVGVFQALNRIGFDGFAQDDLKLLLFVTVYMSREIDAAILREELEETQNEIIFTLAETGEMRSKETGFHVKRVAEYSAFLAKEVGLSSREIDDIRISSTLHDIGKIAIPDSVLLKPGRLTASERAIIETHASLRYDMLKHSRRRILKSSAIIALQHHEKWDGTGYPLGLKGDDIHIFGRITAIADVFDALANDRCYKSAWEFNRIVDLFKEERGSHFDPKLVDIFLNNLDVFKSIKDKYRDQF